VPADASVFALNVVDRTYLLRADSARAAGLYALAVKVSSVVIIAVRGFQYAWPPLAYSVTDDEEASRLYGLVTTWFVVVTGFVVAGATLMGRWVVRLLAQPQFFDAYQAIPWWALYGLFLVFVVVAGRLHLTARNVPAAVGGLAVNVLLLVLLVPSLGIAGAGIALCGSYAVMLVVLWLLTRGRFRVAFERGRLARIVLVLGVPTIAGELLLPTSGVSGFVSRAAVCAVLPALLAVSGFLSAEERAFLRRVRRRTPGVVAHDATS
jgi:O-antigen/teichoic acid export membrane protein